MTVITFVLAPEPSYFVKENPLELVPHEAVDDEVGGSIEDEEPVHQAGQAEEPGRGSEVRTPGNTDDDDLCSDQVRDLLEDAVGHEELCTVDEEPWQVADKEHNDNTDKNTSKIHLMTGGIVTVGPDMGKPGEDYLQSCVMQSYLTVSLSISQY